MLNRLKGSSSRTVSCETVEDGQPIPREGAGTWKEAHLSPIFRAAPVANLPAQSVNRDLGEVRVSNRARNEVKELEAKEATHEPPVEVRVGARLAIVLEEDLERPLALVVRQLVPKELERVGRALDGRVEGARGLEAAECLVRDGAAVEGTVRVLEEAVQGLELEEDLVGGLGGGFGGAVGIGLGDAAHDGGRCGQREARWRRATS